MTDGLSRDEYRLEPHPDDSAVILALKAARFLFNRNDLSAWECEFANEMAAKYRWDSQFEPSKKQWIILDSLVRRRRKWEGTYEYP